MDSEVNQLGVENYRMEFLCLLIGAFLGAEVFSYLSAGFIFYGVAVVAGTLYVFRRPAEGIWVTFFLLAVTSLIYPVSIDKAGVPDVAAFRPYNFVVASMAAALLLEMRKRQQGARRVAGQSRPGPIKWTVALACVFCVATIYGDLSPVEAGALYVLQQSSGWICFFLFLWLGYRLLLSRAEIQGTFVKLRLAALVYSGLFLTKFAYLALGSGLTEATEFAYAQRVALFFSGVVFVLLIAKRLAPEAVSTAKSDWPSALILLPAIVLSGSRGVVGAVVLTIVLLVMIWRLQSLVRLSPLLLAALLISIVILRTGSQVVEDYVVARFLVAPDEDVSYLGRISEMEAAVEAIQRNPFLGNGTLATYTFLDPLLGWRETAFVDNGIGYLLMKTGLLGTGIFTLLVFACLKMLRHLRRLIAPHALIPLVVFVFYLAYLPFGASFFDLRYSWLIGIMCGYSLYVAGVYGENASSWATKMEANGNRGSRSYA
jgi:O-antigen ligase